MKATGPISKKALTERQAEVLSFIMWYRRTRKYSPSIREIGDHFGIRSLRGVTCHLEALIAKGYFVKGSKRAGMIPTELAEAASSVYTPGKFRIVSDGERLGTKVMTPRGEDVSAMIRELRFSVKPGGVVEVEAIVIASLDMLLPEKASEAVYRAAARVVAEGPPVTVNEKEVS